MPRTRPPYPAAFRAAAIELARTSGKTIPELAADLGVSGQTLRNWLHQTDVDAGHGRRRADHHRRGGAGRLRRENQVLHQEREILKGRCLLREGDDPVSRYRFIAAEEAAYPVSLLCRTLGVSRKAFSAWAERGPSAHQRTDQELVGQITTTTSSQLPWLPHSRPVSPEPGQPHGSRPWRVARMVGSAGLVGCNLAASTGTVHESRVKLS